MEKVQKMKIRTSRILLKWKYPRRKQPVRPPKHPNLLLNWIEIKMLAHFLQEYFPKHRMAHLWAWKLF